MALNYIMRSSVISSNNNKLHIASCSECHLEDYTSLSSEQRIENCD